MATTLEVIAQFRDTGVAAGLGKIEGGLNKAATTGSRAFNVLEQAGRSVGSGFEDLGAVVQSVGIGLLALPSPIAKAAGLLALLVPQATQVATAFTEGAKKAEEAIKRQTDAVEAFAIAARQAAADRAIAEATAAGAIGQAQQLQLAKALAGVEEERRARLAALEKQTLDVDAASQARFQIEKAAVDARLALEADFAAKRKALETETTSALLSAALAAAAARKAAEGDPLAAIEGERAARLQSIAEEQKAAQDKIAILEQLTGKATAAAELRRAAEQTALDKTVAAEIEAATKRQAVIEDSTSKLIGIFEKLGPGFERALEPLRKAQFLQEMNKALKELETAYKAGAITAEQYAEGTRKINEQIQKGPPAVQTLAASLTDLTAKIIEGHTALANMTKAQQDLVIGLELPTRSFSEMGTEVEHLTRDFELINQELSLNEARWRNAGQGALDAAEDMKKATETVKNATSPDLIGGKTFDLGQLRPGETLQQFLARIGLGGFGFQHGGVVPGPPGQPMLATVHGGEVIIPRELRQSAHGGGRPIVININQAPSQSPQDLARALMPVLRRELGRGTL